MKKILITGAQGFIGSLLTQKLKKKFQGKYEIVGTDIGFFKNCKLIKFKDPVKIIQKDIRFFPRNMLKNVYAIVHLAALSNDPIGNINKKLTYDINVNGTKKLALNAKKMGVEKFIFSSSCIMYGSSSAKSVNERSTLKPLTEYAKSKVNAEKILKKIASKNFSPIFLRNGTIYGFSPRIRTDTVLNNFIAQAYTRQKIDIYGDGLPFRPVVHVDDICNIIAEFIKVKKDKVHNQAYNIGDEKLNIQIKNLSKSVIKHFKKSKVHILSKKDVDQRTYLASFKKIKKLFPKFKFKKTPSFAVSELKKILERYKINKNLYYDEKFVRLKYLQKKFPKLLA